jgi:carbon-monoxide dehydrogenase medium subunit
MQAFGYYDPTSVQQASGIARDDTEARYLAGGQSLLPAMRLGFAAPPKLVDLGQVPELRGIHVAGDGASITVGAMARHAEVAGSVEVGKRIRALAELAGSIGDAQVRNRGTIGGSLANNDPAADYPAAALALNAVITTNDRRIHADDFFVGLYETALRPGELITAVTFPVPRRAAYLKFRNPASRFAVVGVFVADTPSGPRVAVTGAGARGVFRVREMEEALARGWSPQALAAVRIPIDDLQTDLHASAEYRAHLVRVLAQRAVGEA